MKNTMKKVVAGAVVLSAAAVVQANVININLSGARSGNLDVLLDGTSAVMPAAYTGTTWNDVTDGIVSAVDMFDTDGNATTVDFATSTGSDYFNTFAGLAVCERYRYFSGNASSVGATITLTGLGANAQWDVYCLAQGDSNSRTTRYALGSGTLVANSGIASGDNSNALVQDATTVDTTTSVFTENENYVKFSAVADASGTLVIEAASLSGNNSGSFSGMQLVAIPEPATLGMIGFVGVGLIAIRRRFMI